MAKESMTVVSNIGFFINSVMFLNCKLYVESLSGFMVFVASSIYHMCYNTQVCIIFQPHVLQYIDFFFSYAYYGIFLVYMINVYPRTRKAPLQLIMTAVAGVLCYIDRFAFISYMVYYGFFVVIATINMILHLMKYIRDSKKWDRLCDSLICRNKLMDWIYERRQGAFHPIDLLFVFLGFCFGLAGLLLQIFSHHGYWWMHSLFHLFDATAIMFASVLYNKEGYVMMLYRYCILRCKKRMNAV